VSNYGPEWQIEYWEPGMPNGITWLDTVRAVDVDAARAAFVAKRPQAQVRSIMIVVEELE
jgi:hypothetical protein